MTTHTNCTHPATPAARAKCRKARAAMGPVSLPVDLVAAPPVVIPITRVADATGHMTPNEARVAMMTLLRDHGLTGWTVKFDNARRRAGACDYARKQIRLSLPLMAQRSYADTEMTMTHELAHALTPWHKHDNVWASMHRSLGGNGQRGFEHSDETAPYIGVCAAGTIHSKYRAPRNPEGRYRCKCAGASRDGFTFSRNPNA